MSRHAHADGELKGEVINFLAQKMEGNYCPACAAQALLNGLSFVMSETIRQHAADPQAELLANQVAGHLETMAQRYRRFEPSEPAQQVPRAH